MMQDFEKLGAFYLGKRYDLKQSALSDDIVLYDSKDLTTHAVIIGMTGSGKTGLGIGLLEEAAMDRVPVIAIDPKGDLGNILLTFPDLKPADFEPWINPREAEKKGASVADYAAAQAALWKKGLGEWGQDPERIRKFREATDLAIYTPGSSAGLPVSVLKSFQAPGAAVREDLDLYRERIQATATSILALMGEDADPITSREHILIANVLEHYWNQDRSLDVAGLITAIQNPPVDRIGVMDLESFYPSKDRFKLAMQLNNLLAAPGFEAWMEGESLNAGKLLYTESGKPRISVMSIAHLSDPERMFFVSMLLNEIISWMRAQPGTSSLRAILYMDEIFGYMPPTANPPSKTLFLTLLKQARAYGLGLVLATQNPVDLDYKGLSNTGTWFIGRLQTERDKMRVMEGLEGAAAGGKFDKKKMEQTIAGLGKRVFLLHNVHENEPVIFNTRWVMSYLPGPFTRDQIKRLMKGRSEGNEQEPERALPKTTEAKAGRTRVESAPPPLPPSLDQYFLPATRPPGSNEKLVYFPLIVAASDVGYSNARYNLNDEKRYGLVCEVDDGPVPLDWDDSEELEIDFDLLQTEPEGEAEFSDLPGPATVAGNYSKWEKLLKRWLRANKTVTLFKSESFKITSQLGESEGEFRARLQQVAAEKRDLQVEKLRKRYASKARTLENRLMRAEQRIEREKEQSKQRKMDTAISFGTAILGAVLGRKKLSTSSASRVGTAVKSAGRMRKEAQDVEQAHETMAAVKEEMQALDKQLQREIELLESGFNAQNEELKEIVIKPKTTEVHVHFVGLGWAPHYQDEKGRLHAAWS